MAYTPTGEDLNDLQDLLEITNADKNLILERLLKITGTKALNNMNRSDMPADFQPVLIEMTADAYRLLQAEKAEQAQTVSSASDNGQSVNYKDSAYDKTLQTIGEVLKDYDMQLTRFRKLGW